MKKLLRGTWIAMLVGVACTSAPKETTPIFDFAAFIDHQALKLSETNRSLTKAGRVLDTTSDTTYLPTRVNWAAELEIFKSLDEINRPIHSREYELKDPLKDTRSNLKVRQYTAASNLSPQPPITSLKFYYHDDFSQLKKIEATITETNALYTNRREFILEFEEEDREPLLTRYAMMGYQKMILRDTVVISLVGQITSDQH